MSDKRKFLYTPEEIKHQDKNDNLFEAIGEFQILTISFSNPESLNYYPIETLFKIHCEKQKKIDPTFDIEVFAISEKERIEGVIEKVKLLSDKTFYSEHPTYIQALKYIKFLDEFQNKESRPEPEKTVVEFADYLKHPEPGKLIAELKNIFPNGKNKEAAVMIVALIENELLTMPTNSIDLINSIKNEWNSEFKRQGFDQRFEEIKAQKRTGYKGEVIVAINKVKQFVVI